MPCDAALHSTAHAQGHTFSLTAMHTGYLFRCVLTATTGSDEHRREGLQAAVALAASHRLQHIDACLALWYVLQFRSYFKSTRVIVRGSE